MKIRSLLEQAGISEVTYYALLRNNEISFMPRRRKGHGHFQREHLLAMKVFALLRAHGLRSAVAGAAVEAAFSTICLFSREGRLPSPEAYKVGARLLSVKGRLLAIPISSSVEVEAEEVGRVELDLRGVDALLPTRVDE